MQKQQAAAAPKPKPGEAARRRGTEPTGVAGGCQAASGRVGRSLGTIAGTIAEADPDPVREQFLPQYEQLIIEYYKRLAEENRK